jgi:hypothetical protein
MIKLNIKYLIVFLIRYAFNKNHRRNIDPMVIIHNWEFDTEQPVLSAGIKGRIIHYHGLHKTASKLKKIFSCYQISNLKNLNPASIGKTLAFKSITSGTR